MTEQEAHAGLVWGETRLLPFVLAGGPETADRTEPDPAAVVLSCANCGAHMDERKCKLICSCGYFASCSDYY